MGSYWSDLRASIEAPNLTLGGLHASEIRPKNSPPLEAIVVYYQKIKGHELLNINGSGSSEASEQYKQWVFGGLLPTKKKHLPKQHPQIFPWNRNPNHLGVGAKRGKAKGAIADSVVAKPLYGLTSNLFQLDLSYHISIYPFATGSICQLHLPVSMLVNILQKSVKHFGGKKLGLDTVYAAIPSWKHQSDSYVLRTCSYVLKSPPSRTEGNVHRFQKKNPASSGLKPKKKSGRLFQMCRYQGRAQWIHHR